MTLLLQHAKKVARVGFYQIWQLSKLRKIVKKAEITIFLVPNFFKSGNTLINEKISQPTTDH